MANKYLCQACVLCLALVANVPSFAQENPFGQTFEINTRLRSYVGKPSWLLIIRNVETGVVIPYLFDFTQRENFWFGFTYGRSYQITVSTLQFGPPNAAIHNFCHLENGIITAKSYVINLSGDLTPNRWTSHCTVSNYKNYNFPIVSHEPKEETSTTTTTTTIKHNTDSSAINLPDLSLVNKLPIPG